MMPPSRLALLSTMPGQRPRVKVGRITDPSASLDGYLARGAASPEPATATIAELEDAVEAALLAEPADPHGDRGRARPS